MKGQKMTSRSVWHVHVCVFILAVGQLGTPASAQATTTTTVPSTSSPALPPGYRTQPANLTVAIGDPAVFRCGVDKGPNVTFNFTLSNSLGSHVLTCPGGAPEEIIPQALYGRCDTESDQHLAVWTIRGTSISDNGTTLVCQLLPNSSKLFAVLKVFDSRLNYFILIGCTIGGFFGIMLVFGFLFVALLRSESFREWFRGKPTEEDLDSVITQTKKSGKDI